MPASTASKRFLILGCTAAKRKVVPGTSVPARELYDGPSFNLFRRYERDNPDGVHLLTLSALYGLVDGTDQIEPYDCTLDGRIEKTRKLVTDQVASRKALFTVDADVVAAMSHQYLGLLASAWIDAGMGIPLRTIAGKPGVRLARVKQWLYENSECENQSLSPRGEAARLRGINVSFTAEEAAERLRGALAAGEKSPLQIGSWAVILAGNMVAPKWLIGEFSGLSMGQFHTHDALRILRKLGFAIRQVSA